MPAKNESLLFELATEEIPAAYQKSLYGDWQKRLPALVNATGIPAGEIKVFASARRIAFLISDIAEQGTDNTETLQGPAKSVAFTAAGEASPALLGFAKKVGVTPEKIEFKETGKGLYATATVTRPGMSLMTALPKLLHELIVGFRFPRSMRWGDTPTVYARPIAGYYVQYGATPWQLDGTALKGTVLEFVPQRPIRGHFILDKNPLVLAQAADYASALAERKVLAEPASRRETIAKVLHEAARSEKLSLVENAALLDEVNFLVERPAVVVGTFSADFLRLPDGVILSEMNQHQRYFGLRDANGKLANRFLIVANADTENARAVENIRAGNERVLRARLSDGAFFYDEDLKRPLAERIEDLTQIVFHDGLGTYREKVERLGRLASLFDTQSYPAETLVQAARLAKADLTTQLVFEFDHLQGEIGAVYAKHGGSPDEICTAIAEHYLPRFQGDALPQTRLGALLSLADKWDNILAAFILGKEPTASADPFAIRRQSLYTIQILVAEKIRVSLSALLVASAQIYAKAAPERQFDGAKILQFFKARLATIFESEGFDKKLTRAAIFSGSDDVFDLHARASALRAIAEQDRTGFDALLALFKRMANIVAEVKTTQPPDAARFVEDAERQLHDFASNLHRLSSAIQGDLLSHYRALFSAFTAGKTVVDNFFENVMVNHEDAKMRENRVRLLCYTLGVVQNLLALEELV